MKILGKMDDSNNVRYTVSNIPTPLFTSEISVDNIFKTLKKNKRRWSSFIGNFSIVLTLACIFDIMAGSKDEEVLALMIIFFTMLSVFSKWIGRGKLVFELPDNHEFSKISDHLNELKKSSYTSGFDNVLESTGIHKIVVVEPNFILAREVKDYVTKFNLLLFPDFIWINQAGLFGGQKFSKLNYHDITIKYQDTVTCDFSNIFTKTTNFLSDTKKLGDTWLFTNKDGSPDQRRKANPKIPIFEAANIIISFHNPEEENAKQFVIVTISNREKARNFVEYLSNTLNCQSEYNARDEWNPEHYMAYMLIFIASGVDFAPKDEEKELLLKALKKIFKLSEESAKNAYKIAHSYYQSIRSVGILFNNTSVLVHEYLQLLNQTSEMKITSKTDVYKLAYDIANADNEIDTAERAFLNAMEKAWGVSTVDGKITSKDIEKKSNSDMDVEEELEKYHRMKEKGLITEEEYNTKKKELLKL